MRICSDQPCIVLLTEKDVWIRVNGKEPISLKANHMALLNCENNIIDVSSLNNTLVAHISHDIIKDYLRFLNKDLSQIPVWQRSATPILTLPCLTPDVFRVAAQKLSQKRNEHVHYYSLCYPVFSTVKNSFH